MLPLEPYESLFVEQLRTLPLREREAAFWSSRAVRPPSRAQLGYVTLLFALLLL